VFYPAVNKIFTSHVYFRALGLGGALKNIIDWAGDILKPQHLVVQKNLDTIYCDFTCVMLANGVTVHITFIGYPPIYL
jgi:hypothetical protein